MNLEEKKALSAKLGLPPRLLRLLSAVHESGHALVAHTLDMRVTEAQVVSREFIGLGGDHILIDFSSYRRGCSSRIVPTPDLLAMKVAGFQAAFMWLQGRGVDGTEAPYQEILNTLAGGDLNWCTDFCRTLGRPPLQSHAVEAAAWILSHRWREALALAYALAARGNLDEKALRPFLEAGPHRLAPARAAYAAWRERTAPLWAVAA